MAPLEMGTQGELTKSWQGPGTEENQDFEKIIEDSIKAKFSKSKILTITIDLHEPL